MFEDNDLVYSYSRKQAIEDGVLIDVTETAKEAGFKFPVAVTSALEADIRDIPLSQMYQDYNGRLWDMLYMLHLKIKASNDSSIIHYRIIMHTTKKTWCHLKAVCSPGDDREPVITIMLPHED